MPLSHCHFSGQTQPVSNMINMRLKTIVKHSIEPRINMVPDYLFLSVEKGFFFVS